MAEQGNGIFSGMFGGKKDEDPSTPQQAQPDENKSEQNQTGAPQQGEGVDLKQLQAKIAELEGGNSQLKDQILRRTAEFENYKKRLENETVSRIQYANERLIEDLIPVIDDFERSLRMSKGRKEFEQFYIGVELIYHKLVKVLADHGLKSYDSVGQQFNTDLHDALMQMPKKDVPPHSVIEEVEKGYKLNDRVLRHAKVIVASDDEVASTPTREPEAGESPASEMGQA